MPASKTALCFRKTIKKRSFYSKPTAKNCGTPYTRVHHNPYCDFEGASEGCD
jgi:hypothetical protein